jgi:hypothetical protein
MEMTIILARFWSILIMAFAVIFLINPKSLGRLYSYLEDEKFVFIIGFLSFILGLITILLHNVWEANWSIMITIFGWIALIKGISRIAFTSEFSVNAQRINSINIRWILIFVTVVDSFVVGHAFSNYY